MVYPTDQQGGPRQSILLIEPGLEGGVGKHVKALIALVGTRADFFLLAPNRGGLLRLSRLANGAEQNLFFRTPQESDGLAEVLRSFAVRRIHYHNILRIDPAIARLPQTLNLPYDFTAHDYSCFCPQIYLTTEHFRYCGEPDQAGCNQCLQLRPAPGRPTIEQWRAAHRGFVEGAERVFVPTPSVERRMRRHFPDARFVAAPHPEPGMREAAPRAFRRRREGRLKIVVLGALSAIKGADLLEACALDALRRDLPLEFHLLGYPYRKLARAGDRATVHGRYDDDDLPRRLEALAPDLAWFPAQWPETYSYTLSAVLRAGLPAAATDLGAVRDRLAGRAMGWTLPWTASAAAWNDFFVALRRDPSSGDACRVPAAEDAPPPFDYRRDYLVGAADPAPNGAFAADLSPYRHPLRADPKVLARYAAGYARLFLSAAYRLPGIRSLAVSVFPEYRLQHLRRWLDKY